MSDRSNQGRETYRGVVHPWLCDAMGHLNVRHYMGMFDDAAFQLLGLIAGGSHALEEQGLGWADVRHVVEYKQEARSGTLVVVRSCVTRIGNTSIGARHEMSDAIGNEIFATLNAVTVLFDMNARGAAVLSEAIRERARSLQVLNA